LSGCAIRVENLGKQYRIGRLQHYKTLRDTVAEAFSRSRHKNNDAESFIWALKNASFEVQPGEVLGIIGRNGAGKSTLLKILSRIVSPTQGHAQIAGRVGSLLEVGTGFHPELTGRENIYLNGAILGLRRAEIDRKFDEIVAFAELSRFVDTPVKFFSSGMYMRLAFAVAAHLEAEVLLVDEVLAVGDAAFQKKCLGKMSEVARDGRTILFVSHNMAAVRSLCSRSILIDNGEILIDGPTVDCVEHYLGSALAATRTQVDCAAFPRPDNISSTSPLRIEKVSIRTIGNTSYLRTGESLTVTLEFTCKRRLSRVSWGFYVEALDSTRLLDVRSATALSPIPVEPGTYSITGSIARNPLAPGRYRLGVGARDESSGLDWLPSVMDFIVEDDTQYESLWFEKTAGVFRIDAAWEYPEKLASSCIR